MLEKLPVEIESKVGSKLRLVPAADWKLRPERVRASGWTLRMNPPKLEPETRKKVGRPAWKAELLQA